MVDFAALPPEINSTLMYTGAGSGPMLAAAAAWDALAGELQAVAASYGAVVTSLTDGPWQGPSSAAMAAAATPQIAWLNGAAEKAAQTGSQAAAAASAYEAAFLATVPPPVVEANRALLAALLATNFLGQNTAAIAATEAQYLEMWAQDAAAMYGYSGASAAATALPPLTPQAIATSISGLSNQMNAQINALNSAAAAAGLHDVTRALNQLAGITNTPPWLANPQAALGLTGHTWNANGDGLIVNGLLGDLVEGVTGSATVDGSTFADAYIRLVNPARLTITQLKDYFGLAHDLPSWANTAAKEGANAAKAGAEAAAAALPSVVPKAGLGGIAGAVGNAAKVGAVSVPASWVSTPAANPITVALNGMSGAAAAEPATAAFGGLPMVPGAGTGRSVANFAAPRYGFKPTVVVQPPSGG